MSKKNNWKETKLGFISMQVLIAVVLVLAVLVVSLLSLRRYTHHGHEIAVPNIMGLYIEEAKMTLEAEGLSLEIIDSTYSQKAPLGTIVEQNPSAGSKVKEARTIYAIQNARMRRPVVIPELRDVSLRQAEVTLKALGLEVDSVVYEPSTFRNIILDVRYEGNSVEVGSRLAEGTKVVLVVGKGQGTEEVNIPLVIGKSLEEARAWLLSHQLTTGVIAYDIPPTEENIQEYIVYSQFPESGTIVVEGTSVNLKLSMDIEKTVTADNEQDEEEFW